MTDNYDGDPKMVITADGADFVYNDGQPVMDSGLENNALIALFTQPDWAGNILMPADSQIGSDFEDLATGTITLSKLAQVKNAADRALDDGQQKITQNLVTVGNSAGSKMDVSIRLSPVSEDAEILLSSDAGLNWRNQAKNPANKKV